MSSDKTGGMASFGDVLRSLREIRRTAMRGENKELARLNKSLQRVIDRRRRVEEKRRTRLEADPQRGRRPCPAPWPGIERDEMLDRAYRNAKEMRQNLLDEHRELQADVADLDERLSALAQIDRMLR